MHEKVVFLHKKSLILIIIVKIHKILYNKSKDGEFKLKIGICDDDSIELENCKKIVYKFISLKQREQLITVNAFTDGYNLLCFTKRNYEFDVLILDILMPGMSGIELAKEIRQTHKDCKIIFITSSLEFAIDSYKVNAFYYLLKPFSEAELKSLLNKALDEMTEEKSNSIMVKEKGRLTRLQFHNIEYVESMQHTILFHLYNDEIISCYGTLNEFSGILLSDKRFIKCHKSFIVNMNYVISISNKNFILKNKTLVPISKQVYQEVKNAYIDYFFKDQKGF